GAVKEHALIDPARFVSQFVMQRAFRAVILRIRRGPPDPARLQSLGVSINREATVRLRLYSCSLYGPYAEGDADSIAGNVGNYSVAVTTGIVLNASSEIGSADGSAAGQFNVELTSKSLHIAGDCDCNAT